MLSSTPSEKRRARAAGMTLIETITALAIAVTGIFGVFHLHLRVMDNIKATHEDSLAHQALVNELETLKTLPFAALAPGEAQPFRSAPELDPLHQAQAQVTLEPTEFPGLVRVTASIHWRGQHGRRIERSLTTMFAAREELP